MPAEKDAYRNAIRLQLVHGAVVCFAMEQSGIPFVRDLRVFNDSGTALSGAELGIQLQPDLGDEQRFRLAVVHAGEVLDLARPDFRLEPGRLRNVMERERARLCIRIYVQGECLLEEQRDVDVLAFNEWPGQRAPLGLLAAFVTPNQAALVPLLSAVQAVLAAESGAGAIDGYQGRSKKHALRLVRAAFASVAQQGLTYAGVPASFEQSGQKVRLVETVLTGRTANCLDATLVHASLLECLGLRPLLVLLRGHALLAVWLVEDQFPEGIVEDAARLRTLMDLGQIVAVETTLALGDGRSDDAFERAVAAARSALANDAQFVSALDIHVLRDDGFRPLSFRALDGRTGELPRERELGDIDATRRLLRDAAQSERVVTDSDASARSASPGTRRFQKWKDSLLDLTLRNKLLNFRTGRRSALPLEVPDLALFEDLLAGDESFEVLPKPSADLDDGRAPELVAARSTPLTVKERRLKDLAAGKLHSPLAPDDLAKRARFLERTAKTDLEEGGASTLFVAVGLLRWFESNDSDEAKLAPLLLYPVSLRFDRQKRRTTLRRLEEDAAPNQTLIEKMRRDYRVDLAKLTDLETDESGIDVPSMLRVVRQSIQQMPRWEVLEEAQLGHFAFSKFLMWKDLHENETQLLENRVVQHIADHAVGSPLTAPARARAEELDAQILPADLPCVVSADSTQVLAVHAALSGSGLVLQGPPGTGKSQTITNMIAAALARGQSVLFVSEKMAALEVVHRRLRDVGLEDFCLELHSHKTTRRQVVESFGRALQTPLADDGTSAWKHSAAELVQLKQQLNQYVRALHAPTLLGRSVYQVMGRQQELASFPALGLSVPDPLSMSADRFEQIRGSVSAFATRARPITPSSDNPWRWSSQQDWSSEVEEELSAIVEALPGALREVEQSASQLAATLSTPLPGPTDALVELALRSEAIEHELECLCREATAGPVPRCALAKPDWPELRTAVYDYTNRRRAQTRALSGVAMRWADGFHALDLAALALLFARWTGAFVILAWVFLWSARRRLKPVARGKLPSNRQILEDLEAARISPQAEDQLRRSEQVLSVELADVWTPVADLDELDAAVGRGERARAAWQRLLNLPCGATCGDEPAAWQQLLDHSGAQRSQLERALSVAGAAERRLIEIARPNTRPWPDASSALHRDELASVALRAGHAIARFRDWCFYQGESAKLAKLGLRALVDAHDAGNITPDQIEGSWERAVLARWHKAAVDAEPTLRFFSDFAHDQVVQRFQDRDTAHELLAREWIRAQLCSRVPRAEAARKDSELHLLRREIQKKARHMAIRKLIQSIPELRPRLKPCFLMSPLSVAQYLPARSVFDLVIFDEASQIETHDAIGAIARGKQVVIVGDSKQLPPSRFFSRAADHDDDAHDEDIVDLDSILDEAKARNIPELTLGWHYRSRHHALIEFSNKRYYEERLQVFPAAHNEVADLGIAWHPVPNGVFYSSASPAHTHTNPEEAKALVTSLVNALIAHGPSVRTFGVVTFSLAQKNLIDELLEQQRQAYPEIEQHWVGPEPVFVKNLENVQGDERDEILFSIAYAKNEKGNVNHHFGPLSNPGGERRLNVAITRARQMLRVFSTLSHDQIDLGRTRARGAEDLRAFLRFAAERPQGGDRAISEPIFDSALEREIHQLLTSEGYVVRTKIGCGAYRVDLAVEHPQQPGVYALAVECDGPMYDSAKACRDRDRLRAEMLRGLSWQTHRVWSLAWRFNRKREIDKLLAKVMSACSVPPQPAEPRADISKREQTEAPARTRGFGLDRRRIGTTDGSERLDAAAGSPQVSSGGEPPCVFDRYELVRELRGGGMAECFQARDRENGEVVFLKRVRAGSAHEGSLKRELDIYAKLQYVRCENVLSILGQERDDEYVALITEFADGGDLEHYVRAQPGQRLPRTDALSIAIDITRGLVELHDQDIVHRDLKPANVLRSAGSWKIADFGIAKDQRRAVPGATFQQAGSYGYAPPEQWAGTEAHASADVFAMGKLIAFMITGGTDPDAIPIDCRELRQLAFRCTAQPATQRPSSAELLQALTSVARIEHC